jgi:hypothetical protein
VRRGARLPRSLAWLFPEYELSRIDARRDASLVLTRVLERGRMVDVEWCIRRYGLEGIRGFFRAAPHPEISARTARFWRVVLKEEEETWPSAPPFREASAALWPG